MKYINIASLFFNTEWWRCNQLVPVRELVLNLFLERTGESVKFSFYLASGEMKDGNLKALRANMDILIAGLDVCHVFE